jgi:alpha-beta hydrolase superfamily lysophospholipase
MKSYDTSPSWTQYRDILDTRFGIRIVRTPHETWRKIRGHDVHVDVWEPEGPAKGTLILVHGGGGNGRVLAPFADLAAGLGWRTLALDLPGYGLTRPAKGYRGDYGEWPAVVAQLADETEGPVVLMGLSVGGMTAAFAAEEARGVDGVIATTLLDMGDPALLVRAARWRWLGWMSLLGFRLMPWLIDRLSMPVWLVAPMGAMSSDPAMNAFFARDPLLGKLWVRLRFFRTMHARKAKRLTPRCPLLLVHPGADAWTPTELSRPAFDRVEGTKDLVELSNGSHLPLERPAFEELKGQVSHFLEKIRDVGGPQGHATGREVRGRP